MKRVRKPKGTGDSWGTPQWLFDGLNAEFNFQLDVAASKENFKCDRYYSDKDNGLKKPWSLSNFCNPPYSDQSPWIDKAIEEAKLGHLTVMLLKCDPSCGHFKKCFNNASEIRLINHRIQFEGATQGADFASMIAVFRLARTRRDLESVEIRLVDFRFLLSEIKRAA